MLAGGELLFTQPFSLTSLCGGPRALQAGPHEGVSAGTPGLGAPALELGARQTKNRGLESGHRAWGLTSLPGSC